MDFHPVILSGGAGTRLWPLSTAARPKQFLSLFEGRSLFRATLERFADPGYAPVLVVCNAAQAGLVAADAEGLPLEGPLLEPARRDSAAAIAAASAFVARRHGPDAVMGVFPSDHLIPDAAAFRAAIARAAAVAREGRLVTFGIRPTGPATEFGYLEQGEALGEGAFAVRRFHEKPDAARAAEYVATGRFAWNAGMFVFTPRTFAAEAAAHMPDIAEAAAAALPAELSPGSAPSGPVHLDPAGFAAVRATSIDFALFERSTRVAMVPVDYAWSDIGNWRAARAALARDGDGNHLQGDARAQDSRDTIVLADGLPVRVLGVEGLAIVATPDGVLVTSLERAADIKALLG